MSLYDSFTGVYPVQKTLRFELIPVGETQEHIEKKGYLVTDEHRADSYKKVKKIIDRYHKDFIESVLGQIQLDGLEEYAKLYYEKQRNDQQEKQFDTIKKGLRKQISDAFKSFDQFKKMFGKEMIEDLLIKYTEDNPDDQKSVLEFESFSTYFQGFYENRKNMYSGEGKSTEVAYRIVDQNLPKYLDNIIIYEKAYQSGLGDKIEKTLKEVNKHYELESIEELFELKGFNSVLSQKGIDMYNCIIGGFSESDRVKVQGINETINLYNQQVNSKDNKKIPKCKSLFKQILSDRENISFIQDQFESDEEVVAAIYDFYDEMQTSLFENSDSLNIDELFSDIGNYNLEGVYIKNCQALTDISQHLYSDWSIINHALESNYDNNQSSKNKNTEKYIEKRKKELKKNKYYAIAFINQILSDYTKEDVAVEKYYSDLFVGEENYLKKITDQKKKLDEVVKSWKESGKSLNKNDEIIEAIKELLDLFKDLQRIIQPLINNDVSSKDFMFYNELERMWNNLDVLTSLYNKVRNYITRKPYSIEKYKLNFNRPTLLAGWDKSKERDCLGILLRKNDLYYLCIMDKNNSKVFMDVPRGNGDSCYEKMEYKQVKPLTDFAHVFFAKKNIKKYNPSEEILKIKKDESYIKNNDNFSLDNCHKLIDFYKECIKINEEYEIFNFKFSDTSSYNDISEFYKEADKYKYAIQFEYVDENYINQLVAEGKIYLFQIYNKDFSVYSKGNPNLHTLYWKMLFYPENLKNIVYKLNGQAEIFYRKSSINKEDIIRHPANIPINNKNELNTKKTSVFDYELIKDKRFTIDKYQFHVPITMNFGALGDNHFNRTVNTVIKNTDDVNVIGIDRGERNLLYLVVINSKGEIIKQKSLNEIINVGKNNIYHKTDYHKLLDYREKENKAARNNWKTINTIKELKEGYLSQVIHVITEWMVKYNAIVVLEDLNFGFKRGRQKFEKQVYQKFEKMLIDKLNYYVDKNADVQSPSGLLKALQLTNKFDSFSNMGKQSGFLYYVPAYLTSKIDPTTGFANLFNGSDLRYSSVETSKEFFNKFKSIIYNPNGINGKDYFEFTFDYLDFTYKAEGTQSVWTVCTFDKRIHHYRNSSKNNEWDTEEIDLTQSVKDLFNKFDVNMEEGNLKEKIINISDKSFYKDLLWLFSLTLQMRNSDADKNIDRLISPVLNEKGFFYDSDLKSDMLPYDADANGAYNIAKKGLWIINQIKSMDDDKVDKLKTISNKEWLQFAQENKL
ncbi:MAG: type V CRISPR-associated protein Cpf1 [Lachnospiraceae bacterium]|nr:type V CRISPR-associated protein Cpf1 [Lachnospiraceae bacterium]